MNEKKKAEFEMQQKTFLTEREKCISFGCDVVRKHPKRSFFYSALRARSKMTDRRPGPGRKKSYGPEKRRPAKDTPLIKYRSGHS